MRSTPAISSTFSRASPSPSAFIAGTANSFSVTLGDRHAHISQDALGLFAQDQYTLLPHLTLDIGARYDWNMTPTERENRFVVFDADSVSLVRVGTDIDEIYRQNNWNLQPRAGVVWDASRSGRTIVRLAYGVYVNQPTTNVVAGAIANPPLVTPLSYSGPVGFESAARLARATGLAPSTVDPDFTNATTQSWNVNIQQELVRNVAVMVGYFGGRGNDLRISRNVNQAVNGVRPFPALSASSPILPGVPLGNITQIEGSGRSSYRALWMSLRGRWSDGLRVTGSYTLCSSRDFNSLSTQGVVVQDGYNLSGEWGPSDYDARHRVVASAICELPFEGNALADGWQIAVIVQAQSGSPANIVTSNSTLNGIANTVRPDVTGPVMTIGDVNKWFDTRHSWPRTTSGTCPAMPLSARDSTIPTCPSPRRRVSEARASNFAPTFSICSIIPTSASLAPSSAAGISASSPARASLLASSARRVRFNVQRA